MMESKLVEVRWRGFGAGLVELVLKEVPLMTFSSQLSILKMG